MEGPITTASCCCHNLAFCASNIALFAVTSVFPCAYAAFASSGFGFKCGKFEYVGKSCAKAVGRTTCGGRLIETGFFHFCDELLVLFCGAGILPDDEDDAADISRSNLASSASRSGGG